jgi:2',3'-cyclic-nucleotide 2'-phosphodiesterase / 3'-nucleotidase
MNTKTTLLYTTDLHGYLVEDTYLSDQKSSFGLAQIATLIRRIRRDEKDVIYFDNGDTLSGSLTSLRSAEDMRFLIPIVNVLNDLDCKFSVIGNHEFDFGRKYLDKAVEQSNFPWLAANVIKNRGGKPAFGPAWQMHEAQNGKKIAFIGLSTSETAELAHEDAIKGLSFSEPLDSLDKIMPEVQAAEPDLIVVSYHGGYDTSIPFFSSKPDSMVELKSAITEKYPQINVFFTGHTHGLLADREVNGVHTIQAACNGHYLGRVDVEWTEDGPKMSSEVIPVKGVRLDKTVMESLKPVLESTCEWMDEPIAESLDDFSVDQISEVLFKPSRLMSLIHCVMQKASKADISAAAFWKIEGWKPGTITRRTILNLVPDNYLHKLVLTGKVLTAALERSLCFFDLEEDGTVKAGSKIYEYDIWSGIYYSADLTRPAGKRIIDLKFNGEKIQDKEEYKVVFYHFRSNGALGYDMLNNCKQVWQSKKTMRDYLLAYMKKNSDVRIPVENNWKLIRGEK